MSLKDPSTRVVNLWRIQDMLEENMIKLDAIYQRDIVWHGSKMSMLIDSIMKRYYIPPLLFAVRTDENGKQIRVCIDGKQRLTSILRFMKNEIPYLDESSGITEEVYFEAPDDRAPLDRNRGKLHHRYLSEEAKEMFNDSTLVMIEYSDLDEDQELEIFARVQMGVSITASEKLVATNSRISKFCRDLVNENRHLDTTIRELHGVPFKWIAQLLFILHEKSEKFVATQPRLMEFLKDRNLSLDGHFKRKVRRTIKWLNALFKSEVGKYAITYKNPNECTKQRQLLRNIEFLVFGVYVHELNHSSKAPQLASDLTSLRQHFSQECDRQLFTGNPCWTTGMLWKHTMIESKRRATPAAEQASSSTDQRQGVLADSDSSSSDENDIDSDESDDDNRRQVKKQRQAPVVASKRRQNARKEPVEMKREEQQQAESSSAAQGHVNEHGRPLARRGGKKSSGLGRRT